MSYPITFRPHHFLCTLAFQGMGYSPVFTENYKQIIEHIAAGKDIRVSSGLDDICQPCPHHNGRTCHTQEKIESLDNRHAQALCLNEGDVVTWNEIVERMKDAITPDVFHAICEGCSWKDMGMCEKAVYDLR